MKINDSETTETTSSRLSSVRCCCLDEASTARDFNGRETTLEVQSQLWTRLRARTSRVSKNFFRDHAAGQRPRDGRGGGREPRQGRGGAAPRRRPPRAGSHLPAFAISSSLPENDPASPHLGSAETHPPRRKHAPSEKKRDRSLARINFLLLQSSRFMCKKSSDAMTTISSASASRDASNARSVFVISDRSVRRAAIIEARNHKQEINLYIR